MMRMLWVMTGMSMLFVAPSLTAKRCPCVNKCELQYCTDCIDTHTHTHTCDNVTFLSFCNCVMLCTQVRYSQFVLS